MLRLFHLVLVSLLLATPVWSQDQTRPPPKPSGEIQIPSEKTLEREAFTTPGNPFSTNDATAIKQMEQREQKIDSEVKKGICVGC